MASFDSILQRDRDLIRETGAQAGDLLQVNPAGTDLIPYSLSGSGDGTTEILSTTTQTVTSSGRELLALRVGNRNTEVDGSEPRTQLIVRITGADLTGQFATDDVFVFDGGFGGSEGINGRTTAEQIVDINGNNASPVDSLLSYADGSTVFGGSNSAGYDIFFGFRITDPANIGTDAQWPTTTDTTNYLAANSNKATGFTVPSFTSNPMQINDSASRTPTTDGYVQTWLICMDINQPPFTSWDEGVMNSHVAGHNGLGFDGINNDVYPTNYDVTDPRRIEYWLASIFASANWETTVGTATVTQEIVIEQFGDGTLSIAGWDGSGAATQISEGLGNPGNFVTVNSDGDGLDFALLNIESTATSTTVTGDLTVTGSIISDITGTATEANSVSEFGNTTSETEISDQGTVLQFWVGTQDEYNNITTYSNNVVYLIQ